MPKPKFWHNTKRYYDLKSFFINTFGCKVYKLQIDAGFTCPNRDGKVGEGGCIYCDGRFSRLRQMGSLPSVTEQIQRGKEFYRGRMGAQKFIAYFQTATNTYAPLSKLKTLYDEALAQDDMVGISVGTRPDCVPDDVLRLFEGYATERRHVWLEYGLQSIHDRTLQFINRGHDAKTFLDAVERSANRGVNICVHIIVGLPGETRDDVIETARVLASLPVQGIKIHLLLALKGTRLGNLYEKGSIGMITKEEYVSTVCDILEILPPEMVIQRLTADGYGDIYMAPDWGINKMSVLNAIDREMERRDSWQGKSAVSGKQ
ncbi:MAG TPA: TIGR01212 family radical SAM protein [Syntrophales bacterium]|nr:TIGR01212 family radical SAM protein [Syntrophales bacterium]HPQ44641.1 TIGR01212 family radical SAM protein [Syntrophales bacterium]